MNRLISFATGVGIPFLVYFSIIEIRGVSGIGGITSTLKILGFKHKVNLGICTLIILALISAYITQYFFNKIYIKKIKKAIYAEDLIDKDQIYAKIDTYAVSESMKAYLKQKAFSKS